MDEYIIIYNGESSFIRVYSKGEAEKEVILLIKDEGFCSEDIEVLKVIQKSMNIVIEGVGVEIDA